MGYLPIYIQVGGKPCLVVGGGAIAVRRIKALLEAGAVVTAISPKPPPELMTLVKNANITLLTREYRDGDMASSMLVFAATDDAALDERISGEAARRGIPVNVADSPLLCSFIVPAVVKRGELQIAISTGGASPALSRHFREELENRYGPEYGQMVEVLRAARHWLRAEKIDPQHRAEKLSALANSDIQVRLRDCDYAGAREIVVQILGGDVVDESELARILEG
jgi:siroheme synthase-like protein